MGEIEALEEGAAIIVTWSGGNGPHRYRLHVDARGRRYAAPIDGRGNPTSNALEFIGLAAPFTRVWVELA